MDLKDMLSDNYFRSFLQEYDGNIEEVSGILLEMHQNSENPQALEDRLFWEFSDNNSVATTGSRELARETFEELRERGLLTQNPQNFLPLSIAQYNMLKGMGYDASMPYKNQNPALAVLQEIDINDGEISPETRGKLEVAYQLMMDNNNPDFNRQNQAYLEAHSDIKRIFEEPEGMYKHHIEDLKDRKLEPSVRSREANKLLHKCGLSAKALTRSIEVDKKLKFVVNRLYPENVRQYEQLKSIGYDISKKIGLAGYPNQVVRTMDLLKDNITPEAVELVQTMMKDVKAGDNPQLKKECQDYINGSEQWKDVLSGTTLEQVAEKVNLNPQNESESSMQNFGVDKQDIFR